MSFKSEDNTISEHRVAIKYRPIVVALCTGFIKLKTTKAKNTV